MAGGQVCLFPFIVAHFGFVNLLQGKLTKLHTLTPVKLVFFSIFRRNGGDRSRGGGRGNPPRRRTNNNNTPPPQRRRTYTRPPQRTNRRTYTRPPQRRTNRRPQQTLNNGTRITGGGGGGGGEGVFVHGPGGTRYVTEGRRGCIYTKIYKGSIIKIYKCGR